MKKRILLIVFATLFVGHVWAQVFDFSATCGSGQTLYYTITSDSTVMLTNPNDNRLSYYYGPDLSDYYDGFSKPTGDLIIPETIINDGITYSVTSISNYAFCYCGGLTSITIPNTISSIGEQAFYECNNLDYTTYDNAYYIGNDDNPYMVLISAKNKNIEACEINSRCRFIYDGAFCKCNNLTEISIPDSVISIGAEGFRYCTFLTVIIPNSVTYIGRWAYCNCSNLTNITLGNSVITIGEGAIACTNVTSIIIPNSVLEIDRTAFSWCGSLQSVTIGYSVTYVGENAFEGCGNLRKADFASVENLCQTSFERQGYRTNPLFYAHNLYINSMLITNLVIPESVYLIKDGTFRECNSITSITIGDSVRNIGSYAFYNCSHLQTVIIGKSVDSINNTSFSNCNNLKFVVSLNPIPPTLDGDPFNIVDTIYVSPEVTDLYKVAPVWKRKVILPFYNVKATSAIDSLGTIQGDSLLLGKTATLTAVPTEGYHFVNWSDGNTDNPRSYSTAKDTSFTALFEAHTIVIDSAVAETCTELGKTEGMHCSVCGEILVAQEEIPALGHEFVNYVYNNDATTEADGTETAVCERGCSATDTRVAEGTKLPEDHTAVAEYAANAVNIYATGKTIVVENATEEIRVYDAMGKLVCRNANTRVRSTINVKTSGVYIVKIGSTVKRVVVN